MLPSTMHPPGPGMEPRPALSHLPASKEMSNKAALQSVKRKVADVTAGEHVSSVKIGGAIFCPYVMDALRAANWLGSSGGPVALPSRYSRTAGPEFDTSSKKFFFFRALELGFAPGHLNICIGF